MHKTPFRVAHFV